MDKTNEKYVFISYSSKHQQMADSVRHLFVGEGINCWMAPYDIPAGSSYARVINDAIESCSCFVLLLTDASQNSQFVEKEVERAISYRKVVIPVQLEDLVLNSEFKFYIGNCQIIAVHSIDKNSEEIKKVIGGIKLAFNINNTAKMPEEQKIIKENENFLFNIAEKLTENNKKTNILPPEDVYYNVFLTSDSGTLYFRTDKKTHSGEEFKTIITNEIWQKFVHCCKKLIMVSFPGVEYDEIFIKNEDDLGEHACASIDDSKYDKQFCLRFKVSFLRGNYQKYDSVHFNLFDSFEITLFKQGDYAFRDTDENTGLDYFGIDEKELSKAAKEMIAFSRESKEIITAKKFRRNIYSDWSGGYFLDYIVKD